MATTRIDAGRPSGLVVTSGDLRLTPVSDDDLPGLVDLALDGIHPADMMPFDVPWTQTPADELPAATPSITGRTRPVRAGEFVSYRRDQER